MREKAMKILENEFPMSKIEISIVGEDGCTYVRENKYMCGNKHGSCKIIGVLAIGGNQYDLAEIVAERIEE